MGKEISFAENVLTAADKVWFVGLPKDKVNVWTDRKMLFGQRGG